MEGDDAWATYNLGCLYFDGMMGLPKNRKKAMERFLRAGELGFAPAYFNIAIAYCNGEEKAKHFYELAAVGGVVVARHNLGTLEHDAGNINRAVKHWMISASAGHDKSLTAIRAMFMEGYATKDDFERALRSHKEATDEMKSEQREAAAAYFNQNE